MDDPNFSRQEEVAKNKIKRTKNLRQYKDLSEEDFTAVMVRKAMGAEISQEFEKRIKAKMDEFEKDYDLSDLKVNDKSTLRAFIQTIISLEDFEQQLFKIRANGIDNDSVFAVEKLQRVMSDLRSDASKLQNDLNITRKIRKSDQDVSVQAYIDGLKEKAKKFYESKMGYIFCPKCNMLLGTIWVQYPEQERNKIALVCNRRVAGGEPCGEKIIVGTAELFKNRGTTNRAITPESML